MRESVAARGSWRYVWRQASAWASNNGNATGCRIAGSVCLRCKLIKIVPLPHPPFRDYKLRGARRDARVGIRKDQGGTVWRHVPRSGSTSRRDATTLRRADARLHSDQSPFSLVFYSVNWARRSLASKPRCKISSSYKMIFHDEILEGNNSHARWNDFRSLEILR